jgi:hypothetical protein
VIGKPVGIVSSTWLATRLSRGSLRPPVGWASVAAAGTIAGIGFTVSILIADLAFEGVELDEAKVGVLSAAVLAATLTWLLVVVTRRLPRRLRIRMLLGTPDLIVDLADPVDPSATTSAARSTRRLRCSSTATSSARTAARRSRWCASCCASTATSTTCGGTCR